LRLSQASGIIIFFRPSGGKSFKEQGAGKQKQCKALKKEENLLWEIISLSAAFQLSSNP
jgi:hypothetical protein